MSDFKKFRKGVAYSVIAIVAMVGILGILGGLSYQASVGTGVASSDSQKLDQDASTQKLEYTKAMVLQQVRYSAITSTLDITENGGTQDPETYWECNNVPQPVTREEFVAAISNNSLQYLNSYVQALKKNAYLVEKGIALSDPECMSVELPEATGCNHLNCEYITSGIAQETIDVSNPVKTSYKGPLNVNDVGPIRATHFQNVLYNEFKDNNILKIMSSSMAADCPDDLATKFKVAYEDVCEELKKKLDSDNPEYIICNITEIPSPHTDCTRNKKQETCFSSTSFAAGNDKAILIHLEDLKFEPLADEKHMEWNLKMVFSLDAPECTPING